MATHPEGEVRRCNHCTEPLRLGTTGKGKPRHCQHPQCPWCAQWVSERSKITRDQ